MNNLAIFIAALFIFSAGAFAQELPKIAVYVTGDVPNNEKEALGTRILASLVNSGRYIAIERSNSFLAEIEKEHTKQRSGDIDDSQISALGKQFGVKFVCIAAITPAFGDFQVSARIIDVETAVVIFIGEAFSPLQTSNDLVLVSDNVVENMFSGKTSKVQKQTVQTEQATVSQIQHDAPKGRKLDYYLAARYAMPCGGMPASGVINLETGLIWGNGMFFGFDIGLGLSPGHSDKNDGGRIMIGGGLNLGDVHDLSVENLHLVYGGAAGLWIVSDDIHYGEYNENKMDINFLAPFIKLRWKFIELSYRGLLGVRTLIPYEKKRYDTGYEYEYDERGENYYYEDYEYSVDRLSWNHQIMLGVHFATSKSVRK